MPDFIINPVKKGMHKISNLIEKIPGYVLIAIAQKEINLIKTQKIALALILLYPLIVIGTLGIAFSGSTGIGSVDVAFYAPNDVKGFDTQDFIQKLEESKRVKLLPQGNSEMVEQLIRQRK